MPFSAGTVRRALTSKLGFSPSQTDHEMFALVHEGLVVAVTKISHQPSGRDIGEKNIGKMARQCHVSGPIFRAAITCQVDRDAFVAEMQKRLSGQ